MLCCASPICVCDACAYVYVCMHVCARESDDGLSVTYLNRTDIRVSAVIRGASLRHAEVSAFEDYDMQCNNMDLFTCCYYSFVWSIGALHMEAITLRAFPKRERGLETIYALCPGAYFSLKPPVFYVEERTAWFPFEANHKECETWPTRSHV